MRKVISEPSFLGSTGIGAIKLNAKLRDDISALLIGLQAIYADGVVPPSGGAHPSGPSGHRQIPAGPLDRTVLPAAGPPYLPDLVHSKHLPPRSPESSKGASHIFWLGGYRAANPSIVDFGPAVVFEAAFNGEQGVGIDFRPTAPCSFQSKENGMHPSSKEQLTHASKRGHFCAPIHIRSVAARANESGFRLRTSRMAVRRFLVGRGISSPPTRS